MVSGDKLKQIRKKYENQIYQLFDKLDESGYNTEQYKKNIGGMSDKEFIEMCIQMLKKDDFNLSLEIDTMHDSLTLKKIKKIAEDENVKLTEYVFMPFRNPGGKPMCTLTRVPVIYSQIRRFFGQILQHKNSISNKNNRINPLTGQVIDEDKTASETNIQTYALSVMNQKNVIKESLGPRSDDHVAKQNMLSQIENSGIYRMSNTTMRTENKQSVMTAEAFAQAAGIEMKFARKKNNEVGQEVLDPEFTSEDIDMIFSDVYDEE